MKKYYITFKNLSKIFELFSFKFFLKQILFKSNFNDFLEFIFKFNRRLLHNWLKMNDSLFKFNVGSYKPISLSASHDKTVWQFWDSGYMNAPPIVKACIQSVEKNSTGYNHVILDNSTIPNYLKLPNHILEKYEKGLINKTHYSEIIRFALLAEYGGIWLDATVFLSDQISNILHKDSDYFFVKKPENSIFGPLEMKHAYWILASPPNSEYFSKLKSFIHNYWLTSNKQIDYFISCIAMKILLDSDFLSPSIKFLINESACHLNYLDCHELQFSLTQKFSTDKLSKIMQKSSVHKLTFYFPSGTSREFPGEDFLNWVLGDSDDLSNQLLIR
jgi:hypothetical protein